MHYIKSKFRVNSFRRAAIVFTLTYLACLASIGFGLYTFIKKSEENMLTFGVIVGVTILLLIVSMIISGACRCQLCQASTMRSLKCNHNRKAKRLFGSYRLRIAISILIKSSFRCSYCGEAFNLKSEPASTHSQPNPASRSRQARPAREIPKKRN